ncbi:MAG: amidohydrolase family protein [Vicinamibacterales bacterium]
MTRGARHVASLRRAFVAAVLVLPIAVAAQQAPNRRGWLAPDQAVSDDPRRVPVPPPPPPRTSIVVRNGRVFDGTGAAARPATLVIRGNHIDRVLPANAPASSWPTDAQVIDATGKTVMPGLIDLHTHLTYTEPEVSPEMAGDPSDATLRAVERLRFFLESGVTSVRDVASDGSVPFVLKRWVAQHRVPGPRIFAAGRLITATGGHGAEGRNPKSALFDSIREASGPNDWREAVRENFKAGADLIKLASHYSREEIGAAVDEAHALGLRVTVDAETFYIQWAVEAGVDSVEHPLPRTDETVALMAKKGVASVPTLIPYAYIFDASGGYFHSTSRRFDFSKNANLAMLRKLKEAGVKLGVGTDLVFDWFRYMPDSYITELKSFVEAGFSVSQALTAATKTNAEILDMADRLGTLEPGKLADVLIVDGQPDVRLDDLAKVDIVIRDGVVEIRGGQVVVPRHVPVPPPKPRP